MGQDKPEGYNGRCDDPELEGHPWLGVRTLEELLALAETEGWDEGELEDNVRTFSEWECDQPPTTREIAEEERLMRKRWENFRAAAIVIPRST